MHTRRNSRRSLVAALAAGLTLGLPLSTPRTAVACPFCNAAMQTLSQEIAGADVAVITELVEPMPEQAADPAGGPGVALPESAAAKFRVVQVLRGEEKLEGAKELEVVYFGQDKPGKNFMITGLMGVTGPGLDWTTPVPLSDRAVGYIQKLLTVPATGADRLAFFQEHLEDEDPLLAQDSYDEFARMPYADVIALGPRMHRDKLLKWIDDAGVGPSSRRLYLTMLGVCGQPDDVAMLEELLNYDYLVMKPAIGALVSTSGTTGFSLGTGLIDEVLHAAERRKRESLDALIACYIKLKGPDGLKLVNERFLGNPRVEYKNLHSAIMALRFHGEETDIVPRDQLLESMRLGLDHKEFADQVIPDLTRWEDWKVLPRLVTMFKEATADDWIRPPVVSYLLVAADQPGEVGQQAADAIKELEALDPETVERARTLSAFNILPGATSGPPAADPKVPAVATDPKAESPPAGEAASAAGSTTPNAAKPQAAANSAPDAAPSAAVTSAPKAETQPTPVLPSSAKAKEPNLPTPSKVKMVGVPLLAAGILLAIFAVLLRGADPRSSDEPA